MAWMGSWSVELKHLDILQKEDKGKLSSWLEEEDDKRGVVLLVFGKGKKVPWVPHGIGEVTRETEKGSAVCFAQLRMSAEVFRAIWHNSLVVRGGWPGWTASGHSTSRRGEVKTVGGLPVKVSMTRRSCRVGGQARRPLVIVSTTHRSCKVGGRARRPLVIARLAMER
ncbi:hypothetical protein CRG98_018775 [Punica granatum]|uniref:Uncharacterized protein n=1 Tax=Punica granatum TaxID=22663 RepID=A0A2I0JX10_PUNGR|nr:hypothetical protein CRG98_018775 [Punica granatum]